MSRYVAITDIIPSLVGQQIAAQITTDNAAATEVDESVMATFIGDAEAEIDGYLGARYDLPLPRVPTLITRLAARMVRYRLYTSRPGLAEEWLTKDYEAVLSTLEKIRKGDISLGMTPTGGQPGAEKVRGRRVRASSRAPVFGRDNMEGF